MFKQNRRPESRDITDPSQLTQVDLQAIKSRYETVGIQRVDQVLPYLADSLGIRLVVEEPGHFVVPSMIREAILDKQSHLLADILTRVNSEIGEIQFPDRHS